MQNLSRRIALKIFGTAAAWFGFDKSIASAQDATSQLSTIGLWKKNCDRVWLGEQFWANPMEDWRIVDGAAECQTGGGDRNVHLITHQLTNSDAAFQTSVRIKQAEVMTKDGGAGFRIGIHSDINESRSNCFAKNGIIAGVIEDKLVVGDRSSNIDPAGVKSPDGLILRLVGTPTDNAYTLLLQATDVTGKILASVTATVPKSKILGNIAVVNNFDASLKKQQGARYRFSDWAIEGDAFTVRPESSFGPILWSMYSLSDSRGDDGFVMKISALTGPLGESDDKDVELRIQKNNEWKSLGTTPLDSDSWVATFRIPKWDEKSETAYQLVYRQKLNDGTHVDSSWTGKIKPNPTGRPLRLAALTCQKDYGFPYEPVANNVTKLDPDMLYFSGDQLYEDHGGYGLIRDPAGPAILNYLRKFYMFGWAFRHAMKDRPTICIPDDHDVFQGNIWGEGGAKMREIDKGTSSKGGYREPVRMVNVVHKTCAAHHPDYFDPTPVKQGMSVYYGDMVYGGVGFAILGDRQFKSGPENVDTASGRADHVHDADFDTSVLDKPGLELLGERQEKFLESWVADWRSHEMKVLLSQTVFAGVATHHGEFDGYLKADLDSGGWPQTARNRTINILRKGRPLHINGDQHLTTLIQYGVEKQRDGCWSFCPPAISVGYPRWWRPDEIEMKHKNRPSHGLSNTGEYVDGFGNKAYVYAVGNPEVGRKKNRYELAHQKGSGFGLVTIDTEAKTYKIESFRFLIDPNDGKSTNQFPGWPVVLHQQENGGDNLLS